MSSDTSNSHHSHVIHSDQTDIVTQNDDISISHDEKQIDENIALSSSSASSIASTAATTTSSSSIVDHRRQVRHSCKTSVSQSSLRLAALRWEETLSHAADRNALVNDHYAEKLANGLELKPFFLYRNLTKEELNSAAVQADIQQKTREWNEARLARPDTMIRCRYIDLYVEQFIRSTIKEKQQHIQVSTSNVVENSQPSQPHTTVQIVLLGAGMDTRALRLPMMEYAQVSRYRMQKLLSNHPYTCRQY